MAYSSRLLDALDDIVTELDTIASADGYYTDPTVVRAIRPADKVVDPPEIGIELGDEELLAQTSTDEVFHSETQVYIAGTIVLPNHLNEIFGFLLDFRCLDRLLDNHRDEHRQDQQE